MDSFIKQVKSNWGVILVLVVSVLPLFSLLTPGLPVTHDGQDHVARIANFYMSLTEGNWVPRWASNLNWGFGHPILMFLYPFPSYIASFFHFLGFSLVDSVKIVFAITFTLSGLSMYFWIRNFAGVSAGVIASIMYMFAPYRFIDLYVRGAIGEHVAFVFTPLILFFMLKVKESKGIVFPLVGLAFSMAGLILSHNAISLMFLPFIFMYGLYLYLDKKKIKRLGLSFLALGYGFLLSLFFWLPAFIEGKYTLRDIVTGDEALSRFVEFKDLIYGTWNYGGTGSFSVQVGIVQWLFVILAPIGIYLLHKSNKKGHLLYISTIVYFIFSIFIMTQQSEFIWQTVTTLQKFQFPWRFLTVTVFVTALLGGLFVSSIKNKTYKIFLMLAVLSLSIFPSIEYWSPKDFQIKDENFYSGIYESTTDTGESAPIWSVRFMEKKPEAKIEVIEGKADIEEISRTSTRHSYIINSDNSSRILENTLYFPGWKVYVNEEEYRGVQFQDPDYRGLMTFKILDGESKVDVVFEETLLRKISNYTSLAAFGLVFVIAFLYKTRFIKSL